MKDEITLRQEIKEWRADNYQFGNKTPLERRAEKLLKDIIEYNQF